MQEFHPLHSYHTIPAHDATVWSYDGAIFPDGDLHVSVTMVTEGGMRSIFQVLTMTGSRAEIQTVLDAFQRSLDSAKIIGADL